MQHLPSVFSGLIKNENLNIAKLLAENLLFNADKKECAKHLAEKGQFLINGYLKYCDDNLEYFKSINYLLKSEKSHAITVNHLLRPEKLYDFVKSELSSDSLSRVLNFMEFVRNEQIVKSSDLVHELAYKDEAKSLIRLFVENIKTMDDLHYIVTFLKNLNFSAICFADHFKSLVISNLSLPSFIFRKLFDKNDVQEISIGLCNSYRKLFYAEYLLVNVVLGTPDHLNLMQSIVQYSQHSMECGKTIVQALDMLFVDPESILEVVSCQEYERMNLLHFIVDCYSNRSQINACLGDILEFLSKKCKLPPTKIKELLTSKYYERISVLQMIQLKFNASDEMMLKEILVFLHEKLNFSQNLMLELLMDRGYLNMNVAQTRLYTKNYPNNYQYKMYLTGFCEFLNKDLNLCLVGIKEIFLAPGLGESIEAGYKI